MLYYNDKISKLEENHTQIVLFFPLLLRETGIMLSSVREITRIQKCQKGIILESSSETAKWFIIMDHLLFTGVICENNGSHAVITIISAVQLPRQC